MEKERYETLLDKFYEKGGSRNMQLSAADIEVKLATDLRLEEGFYIETAQPDLHVRRRQRKTNARKRSARGGAGSVTAAGAGGADEGEAGVAGGNDDLSSVASHTTVNDDEVIRQVYSYRPPHQHGLY